MSIIDVVWWIVWGMFVYIDTSTADNTMCVNSDCLVKLVPVAWFWTSLAHTSLNWTALAYFFAFVFYLLIAVPELIFWCMYMFETPLENNLAPWLLNMWVTWPAHYGGWILFLFPWLFYAVQLSALTLTQPGFVNAAVGLAMWLVMWLFHGIVHTLGFGPVNRKFERELGHDPSVIPTKKAEAPVAEEPAEEVEEEAEAEEEPVEEEEEDDEEEDADNAFQSTW